MSQINALIAQGGGEGTDFLRAIYQGQQMAAARRQGEIQDVQLQKALREEERAQGQLNALAKLADQYQAAGDRETAGLIRAGGSAAFAKLLDQKMDPKSGYMAAGDVIYDVRGGTPKPVGGDIPMVNGQPYAPGLATGGRGPVPAPGGGGFADRVVQRESGGDPNATNPNSTATGAGQFLERTWLDLLPRHAPGVVASVAGPNADLKNPQTRAALLDLRRDPDLSKTMVDAYAKENAAYLRSAGIDPTPANLMVAHFLGGAGATRFLQADPNAPATSVVSPDAVMANRNVFFDQKTNQPRTVGHLLQMAEQSAAGLGGQGGGPAGSAAPQAQGQPQPSVTPMTGLGGRPYTKNAPPGMMWGVDAQGGMVAMPIPGTGTATLTPQEAQAAGFQPNAVVQRDASGKLSVVEKGDTLSPEAFQQKVDLARAGRAETTIDMKGQGEFEKRYEGQLGEMAAEILKGGSAARNRVAQLQQLEALLRESSTGKMAPGRATTAAWAKSLGLSDDSMRSLGMDPNAPMNAEGIRSITNALTVSMIGPGGFPANNFSDADRAFLMETMPQLSSTPEGNRIIVQALRRAAERSIEQEQQWLAARQEKKTFEQFQQQWNDYVRTTPLFPTVDSEDAFKTLKPGTVFTAPDGTTRVKQGGGR
ncbi:hypothetical protein FW320_12585 [Azospirillum sp. Vi22]|uniref:hypothetical protein n=1 Tax=Azospirillum baldaniorum TaxID=1064539 RepID=UPI00157B149D|nr:hypothetical protein [Azospirillum baldaniorum]NUB07008.1 hypothetical protein [Azospirillum baldaniorum]